MTNGSMCAPTTSVWVMSPAQGQEEVGTLLNSPGQGVCLGRLQVIGD